MAVSAAVSHHDSALEMLKTQVREGVGGGWLNMRMESYILWFYGRERE